MLSRKILPTNRQQVSRGIYKTADITSNFTSGSATLSNVSIGVPREGRLVALYISGGLSASTVVTSVTIAGVSATLAVQNSSQIRHNSIWYAQVSSGSTAQITITIGNTSSNQFAVTCVALYEMASSTPVTNVNFTAGTALAPSSSVTITPPAGGLFFAGYSAGAIAAGTTASWTNATEISDFITISSTSIHTVAKDENLTATPVTISATCTDASVNNKCIIVASWS